MSLNLLIRTWDAYIYEADNKRRGRALQNLGRAAVALPVALGKLTAMVLKNGNKNTAAVGTVAKGVFTVVLNALSKGKWPYQAAKGLPVDGAVGNKTWEKMLGVGKPAANAPKRSKNPVTITVTGFPVWNIATL